MAAMTTAELRGYQQICRSNGAILAIACDQRSGIRTLLTTDPAEQKKITDTMLGDTKTDVVTQLARHAPCVLLDAVCAVPRVIQEGTLPRDVIGLDAPGQDFAMGNGAAGVIAGRALWKDCVSLDRARLRALLLEKAVPRLRELQAILGRYPQPLAQGM